MPTLNEQANAVLQEFGGILPESVLSFEDAKREFSYCRAIELQRIGIAATNKTVTVSEMILDTRDGVMIMPTNVGDLIPGAVEYEPSNLSAGRYERHKVTIVNVDEIPAFEGNRAIAFYGEPMRYRISFDSWETGRIFVYYDPIEDITDITGDTSLTFPRAFWTYLIKTAAKNLINLVRLKMSWHLRTEDKEQFQAIMSALNSLEISLNMQSAMWKLELDRWINRDLSQTPYLRRSNVEIMARGYHDISNHAFDHFE